MKLTSTIPELEFAGGFEPELLKRLREAGVVKVFGATATEELAALHAGFDVTVKCVFRPEAKVGVAQKLRDKFKSKPPVEEDCKPFNVFISARKPEGEEAVVPPTAWEQH